jgi:hypothetical protein
MSTPTPPWQVGPWDLRPDLDKVREQWIPVREILRDPALYDLRMPSVSAWSCGEQAGHILLAARLMAVTIADNLSDPARDRDGEQAPFTRSVLRAGSFARGAARAPQVLEPEGRRRDDDLELFPTVVDAWEGIAAREQEMRACAARGRHLVFGYLTSSEWVRMCAVHTAHHLAIVRDIREA